MNPQREVPARPDATPLHDPYEITGFTVLRDDGKSWYYRITSYGGDVHPLAVGDTTLGFNLTMGYCLEKALAVPTLHKVYYQTVAPNEPVRFHFEKRSPYTGQKPPSTTIPLARIGRSPGTGST